MDEIKHMSKSRDKKEEWGMESIWYRLMKGTHWYGGPGPRRYGGALPLQRDGKVAEKWKFWRCHPSVRGDEESFLCNDFCASLSGSP